MSSSKTSEAPIGVPLDGKPTAPQPGDVIEFHPKYGIINITRHTAPLFCWMLTGSFTNEQCDQIARLIAATHGTDVIRTESSNPAWLRFEVR